MNKPKPKTVKDTTSLKGYTGVARKKYNLGMYSDMGFKDSGVYNNKVVLKTDKYPTRGGQDMVAKNLSKLNPGMNFSVQYQKKNKK